MDINEDFHSPDSIDEEEDSTDTAQNGVHVPDVRVVLEDHVSNDSGDSQHCSYARINSWKREI